VHLVPEYSANRWLRTGGTGPHSSSGTPDVVAARAHRGSRESVRARINSTRATVSALPSFTPADAPGHETTMKRRLR
jgi:hypothetical protein